jgi:DNA primase
MSIVENILSLNIEDVISKYGVQLKRKGSNSLACCPFHNEKTPSFTVNAQKGIFKCFGCGEGGNAISFVMKLKNMNFIEACQQIASDHSLPFSGFSEDFKKEYKEKKSLKDSVAWLADYYANSLVKDTDPYKYAVSRWEPDIIKMYNIGFAPKGFEMVEAAKINGHFDNLVTLSYIRKSEKNSKVFFPSLQNRLIFPIWNSHFQVIGMSGRAMGDDEPKFLNSYESVIFNKSAVLYGLNFAYKAIVEKKTAYLVEGFADVIKLHSLNKPNTVATSGTALTAEAIDVLKKITNHVTIIGDYDPPSKSKDNSGEKAMMSNAVNLIKKGMLVNIVHLIPDNLSKKADPDSFFENEVMFDAYIEDNTKDFFIFKANQSEIKASNNKQFQISIIDELCQLLQNYSPSVRERYIEDLSKIIKPRKAWTEKIKEISGGSKDDDKVRIAKVIPKDITYEQVDKYGFYQHNNQYYFHSAQGGFDAKTNFVLSPIMHIPSNVNAKRIFEIKNTSGHRTIIELAQKDMNTVQGFKLRIESLGNFLYEGNETDMNKLKRWLYETTDTCEEISQLGWQKPGFFAWANGIYIPGSNSKSEFIPVDEYGIVDFNGRKFYLPAFSKIFENDPDLFQTERRFLFREGSISSEEYFRLFFNVFGDNAVIALSFFFASLFRDVYFAKFDSFPILNFFGPKGTGKSDMAIALLKFFGNQSKGPNIVNSTKPAMADHLSMYSNALVQIDEYKNSIDPDKVEFLKSVYDGTGRTRMNMDRDKKKETTKVDVGLMLCGQEMPTLDIALFSRLIFMVFHKTIFSETEKNLFENLKLIQHKGLGHIVHEILDLRAEFVKSWVSLYDSAYESLKNNNEAQIEERIIKSYSVLLSAFNFISNKIKLPVTKEDGFDIVFKGLINQNRETKAGNEVSIFWSIFENNAIEGTIEENVDYKIDIVPTLKTTIVDVAYQEPKTILFVRMTRVVPQYRKTGLAMREAILPAKTIDYYLKHSTSFLGIKNSMKFMVPGVMHMMDQGKETRTVTSAYCFDYKMLNIDIIRFKASSFGEDDVQANFEYVDDSEEAKIAASLKSVDKEPAVQHEISYGQNPDY